MYITTLTVQRDKGTGIMITQDNAEKKIRIGNSARNSKAVQRLASAIEDRGILFEENYTEIPCRPDIVLLGKRIAVFCEKETKQATNWKTAKKTLRKNRKLELTKSIDRYNREMKQELKNQGWTVVEFLYCEVFSNAEICADIVEKIFDTGRQDYNMIDLFAGIGGIRKGFELGFGNRADTVFVSELNNKSRETYQANFNSPDTINTDITRISEEKIPPFDICLAGFPCQAFSIAGNQQGFQDYHKGICRGTLFFDVVRICELHHPKVIFCENVKGLLSNDRGRTIDIIKNVLKTIGYKPHIEVLNSRNYGVPQNRERVYIVAFREDIDDSKFRFPGPTDSEKTLKDILEKEPVSVRYYMGTTYMETLRRHKAHHEKMGHGFGFQIKEESDVASALMCGGMGRERNLIIDHRITDYTPVTHIKGEVNKEDIRRMTPREWARLQGFPDSFVLPVSENHLYAQLGNSVTVPVIEAIAREIFRVLESNDC